MCNAQGMAMGAQGAGGIYGAYSSIRQGKMQDEYYSYVAESAEKQAELSGIISEKQRTMAMDQAANEAKRVGQESDKLEGAQRAQMAANGILGSVTSQDIAADSLQTEQQDKETMQYNAALKDWEMKQQAEMERYNLKSQAAQARVSGKNAKASGYMNAAGSLLGSAAAVADSYSKWKTTSEGNKAIEKAVKEEKKVSVENPDSIYKYIPSLGSARVNSPYSNGRRA